MKKRILLTFLALGAMIGCQGVLDNVNVKTEISMPVGSFVVNDSVIFSMMGDYSTSVSQTPEGVMAYNAEDNISVVDQTIFNNLFEIRNQSLEYTFSIPKPPVVDPNSTVSVPINMDFIIPLDIDNGVSLEEIIFDYSAFHPAIDEAALARAGIDNLTITMKSYTNSATGEAVSTPVNTTTVMNRDYVLRTEQEITTPNSVTFNVTGSATPSRMVDANDIKLSINISVRDVISAKGDFGQREALSPVVNYTVNDQYYDFVSKIEYVYFGDPQIIVEVQNNFEVSALVTIDKLNITNTPVIFKPGYDKFLAEKGKKSTFTLSNASTLSDKQLSALLDKDFRTLSLQFDAKVNPSEAEVQTIANPPEQYTQETNYSVNNTNSLDVTYKLFMPFEFILLNAQHDQLVELDLASIKSDEIDIEDFALGFAGLNTIPFDVKISAYTMLGTTRTELFAEPITIPASTSVNTVPAVPYSLQGSDMIIAPILDNAISEMIKSGTKLYFNISFSSKDVDATNPASSQLVKLYTDNALDLKILVGTTMDISLSQQK